MAHAADRLRKEDVVAGRVIRVDPRRKRDDPTSSLYKLCRILVRGTVPELSTRKDEIRKLLQETASQIARRSFPRDLIVEAEMLQSELPNLKSATDDSVLTLAERAIGLLDRVGEIAYGGHPQWLVRLLYEQVNDLKHEPSGLRSWRRIGVPDALVAMELLVDACVGKTGG